MSFAVFYGRELRFSITPYASRVSLEALATDEQLEAMLRAIQAAYSEEYDGSNFVGKYAGMDTFDGLAAIDDYLRDKLVGQEVWLVEDWMDTDGVINTLMQHGSIEAYANDMIDRAEAPLIGDMADAVASQVATDVEHYIRMNSEPSDDIKRAAKMLSDYNGDKYGYLLTDYIAEFENDEA